MKQSATPHDVHSTVVFMLQWHTAVFLNCHLQWLMRCTRGSKVGWRGGSQNCFCVRGNLASSFCRMKAFTMAMSRKCRSTLKPDIILIIILSQLFRRSWPFLPFEKWIMQRKTVKVMSASCHLIRMLYGPNKQQIHVFLNRPLDKEKASLLETKLCQITHGRVGNRVLVPRTSSKLKTKKK